MDFAPIFYALKIIFIFILINAFMEFFFKWLVKQPTWIKLALVSFFFCLVFWYPFVDYFFSKEHDLPWYKSIGYALVPSIFWYLLNLALYYYAARLLGEEASVFFKDNVMWLCIIGDTMILAACLAITVVFTSNFKVIVAVIMGYKLLGFVCLKPITRAIDKSVNEESE